VDLRPSSRRPSGPGPSRTATLLTDDGERISAAYDAPSSASDLVFVLSHGFTGGWRLPDSRAIAAELSRAGAVVSYDSRGHGSSSGVTTLGDREVLDLDAGVRWARWLGFSRVVTIGFSMGGTVVLRHAALAQAGDREAPDAVVSVSAAGFWFYKGTPPMRLLHRAVESPFGRSVLRHAFHTRVTDRAWEEPYPLSPQESAGMIPPVPLLVVHGDRDSYFPVEHARAIVDGAREGARRRGVDDRTDEWIESGFAHAESAADDDLVRRIAAWATSAASWSSHVAAERSGGAS
jgi:pimeloyl-ACP methyl ester carboxylesterase